MADVKTSVVIQAKVDGLSSVQGLEGGLSKLGKSADTTGGKFAKFNGLLKSFGGVIASVGIGALVTRFAEAGVEADRTAKRIDNLASQFGETARVTEIARKAAGTYGISQTDAANAVADLYARLRPVGTSLNQIETAFIGVNNAAGLMGLTAEQTDNVMLQLSQALGSGKLQGDEFRSVMEQLPSIGQAVAEALNTDVGSLKALASEGKITSDILLQALADLAEKEPPPPDAYKRYQAAVKDLSTAIGTQLLPALTPIVDLTAKIIGVFSQLPGPIQTVIVAIGGLGAAAVVLAPLVTAFGAIGPVIAGIGPLLAGLVPAITGIVSALSGILPVLAAVFTGPVGWVALLIGAGVAIYAFRDQIGAALKAIGEFFVDAFNAIGDLLKAAAQAYIDFYVKPVLDFAKKAVEGILDLFGKIPEAIKAPFIAAANTIKSIFKNILQFLVGALNSWISRVNYAISLANRLPGVSIRNIPTVSMPKFAAGGVVTNPTVALVGEKEREYIIPESKMARASANYLSGMRGGAVIPAFASGGVVGGRGGMGAGNTTVQINTGPVLQQDGQRYVTIKDLENALKDFGTAVFSNARTPGGRRYQGVRA